MSIYAKQNVLQPLVVAIVGNTGSYITGLVVTYEVRKCSDDSLVTSGTLASVGNIYIDNITLATLDKCYVLYITPTGYENGEEEIVVDTATLTDLDSQLETIATSIAKILGLSQSNYRVTNQVYDTNGCLTNATISIYPTAADTLAETNVIAQYAATAVFDVNDRLTDYTVVEI